MPHSPMACPPRRLSWDTRSLLTLPQRMAWTTSMVVASVYRRPSTKRDSWPIIFSMAEISGPPPWTATTRMPTRFKRTMSLMTERRRVSETMALPPYFTTTVLPVNFWI